MKEEKKEYRPDFTGLNIFAEAKLSELSGFGYRSRRFKLLWKSKTCGHNWLAYEYGIRWSDIKQRLPIWNTSHNCQRSLTFGFGLVYLQITYYRKSFFNQKRAKKLPFHSNRWFWKIYQLLF